MLCRAFKWLRTAFFCIVPWFRLWWSFRLYMDYLPSLFALLIPTDALFPFRLFILLAASLCNLPWNIKRFSVAARMQGVIGLHWLFRLTINCVCAIVITVSRPKIWKLRECFRNLGMEKNKETSVGFIPSLILVCHRFEQDFQNFCLNSSKNFHSPLVLNSTSLKTSDCMTFSWKWMGYVL